VDIFGIIFFLLPAMILLAWMTWPFALDSFVRNEGSPNAGGLLRWPVKMLLPLGFLLLTLQGLSELIKRVALLRGIRSRASKSSSNTSAPSSKDRPPVSLEIDAAADVRRLVVFLLIGFPVAFSLCAVGLFFGFLSIELGFFTTAYLGNLPLRVFGILSNDLLLSIPFFTLMGAILERCGLAEDLLEGTGQLFGKVPGGLAYAVIIVGAMLGAITGTVAASVIAMGMISLPIMMKYGYDMRIATGVIAASGTITQLIPPSLVLIVLGDQLGKSVGDMYAGAIGPSLLQIAAVHPVHRRRRIFAPHKVPPMPDEALHARGWPLYWRVHQGHGALHRADLPRARHHLHGPRHADRGRRHGRGGRGGAGRSSTAASPGRCCARRWRTPCGSPPW
jgi:hypothetical protein